VEAQVPFCTSIRVLHKSNHCQDVKKGVYHMR
jgi:hypothetical protein